jgi:galactonate dehydratase
MTLGRRELLTTTGTAMLASWLWPLRAAAAVPRLRVTGFELRPVRATTRTVWLFVRLTTDTGLTGLGEASDAFGFANTTADDAARMRRELQTFFSLIEGRSPFEIESYRQRAAQMARKGLVSATAFSAIEQALWDLAGQALEVPTYVLLGGKVRSGLPVYANINRATNPRTPDGFAAAAQRASADGFKTIKAAPFDGFPPPGSPADQIARAIDVGIDSVRAMRAAVGPTIGIMIDCHSFFDVEQSVAVADRLGPYDLTWYEEPVPPERVDDTVAIHRRIKQPMAGGEVLFGLSGFSPLVRRHAVDTIMPDVKHCGGLLEMTRIAAMAADEGVMVAPHNPSGPVSTAASVQVCAGMKNVNYLELQYGEVSWRSEVVVPVERFVDGTIEIPDRPGLGIALNEDVIRSRSLAI